MTQPDVTGSDVSGERSPHAGAASYEGTRFGADSFGAIARATRNGFDESLHHGAAVVVAADGEIEWSVGDPALAIYPRSALKPLQASAMLRAGLDLPDRLLAVVAASHSGEPDHLAAVTEILHLHGLTVDDLANSADLPYGVAERMVACRSGVQPSSLLQNCSGKHAGMLATCVVQGWPTDGYLHMEHPLQRAITAEIDSLGGGASVVSIGVDGCGAPTHVMSMVDLARALNELIRSESAVVTAMQAVPDIVGGTDRDVTLWMRAVPGLVAKEGAAGVMLVGLADGRTAAMKIADGSDDVRRAVTPGLLRRLGVDVDGPHARTRDLVSVTVQGHGAPVGRIESMI